MLVDLVDLVFQLQEELQVEVVQVKVNQDQLLVQLTQVEVVEVLILVLLEKLADQV
jgi:hypothetical protein